MAKSKNKNIYKKLPNREKPKKADFSLVAKKISIAIIIISMLSVVLLLLFVSFSTPEYNTKTKVESIAKDYYENFFYPGITKYGTTEKALTEIMDRYKESGFSTVYFRQLLLYDNQKHADASNLITAYCDENDSFIKIYPEPPYGQQNYHIDYHYACDF